MVSAHHHRLQYVEGEYIKPEEYDLFLKDPSDFMLQDISAKGLWRAQGLYNPASPDEPDLHVPGPGLPVQRRGSSQPQNPDKSIRTGKGYQGKLMALSARLSALGFHEMEGSISFTPLTLFRII